jgi:PadR family transcriptional regulator, regulatory protein PadR
MKLKTEPVDLEKIQSTERWEQQMRKGALEMATLAALWSGRLYGLEIIRRFEDSSQLALAEGTIYPILSRLKSEGLLASEWVEAEAGHPRKYYWLTAAGRARLQQMAGTWTEFSRELGRLLKPVINHSSIAAAKEEVAK